MKTYRFMAQFISYGFQKTQMIILTFMFPVIGFLFGTGIVTDAGFIMKAAGEADVELAYYLSKWGFVPSGLYFGLSGIYMYQLFRNLAVPAFISSSPYKKFFTVKAPLIASFGVTFVVNTVYMLIPVLFTAIMKLRYPAMNSGQEMVLAGIYAWVLYSFFNYLCSFLYLATCMNYFILSLIVMLFLEVGWMFCGKFLLNVILENITGKLVAAMGAGWTLFFVILTGYAVIFAAGALSYALSLKMYRKPVSELAYRSMVRSKAF